jgi:hypothetical protein
MGPRTFLYRKKRKQRADFVVKFEVIFLKYAEAQLGFLAPGASSDNEWL